MKIIKPRVEILDYIYPIAVYQKLEACGRTCYKSEHQISDSSAEPFVRALIKSGHESVLEHVSISVRFICDRGVSHEIVRHRIASYSQESTRYCNYSKGAFGSELTVIEPCFLEPGTRGHKLWKRACSQAEDIYFLMLNWGCKPQEARAVLPNSLKTELVMTANLREWRHFLRLRTDQASHPQMREVANMLQGQLQKCLPVVFEDLEGVGV